MSSTSPEPPQLTVVIPFFNAAATIERTAASLAAIHEAYRPHVLIHAVDDGSTDDSAALFTRAADAIPGLRYTITRQENAGAGAARNTALEQFTDGWVLFLDADDELQVDPYPMVMAAGDFTALAAGIEFHKAGRRRGEFWGAVVTPQNFLDVFTARNPFHPSCLIFRRELVDELFDPDLTYLEDWRFWIDNPRVFERVKPHGSAPIARVHAHGGNKTSNRVLHGTYRGRIARELLARPGLTTRQRNNLRIQVAIGDLQQGRRVAARSLAVLPCDALLFVKLLAYRFAGPLVARLDPYG